MNMNSYYIVDGKKINLVEESWNYLIILDACRYDFFKKVYKKYLECEVKKGNLSSKTYNGLA